MQTVILYIEVSFEQQNGLGRFDVREREEHQISSLCTLHKVQGIKTSRFNFYAISFDADILVRFITNPLKK